jgi:phosphoribosylformimino-5-aminoimidazole carboxamide ribotide isomerase
VSDQGSLSEFQLLGVVDVRHGLAVRARGGRREEYAPIDRVAGDVIPRGDAEALARTYVERFGVGGLYLADLDAIEGRQPHVALTRAIASIGAPLWLDVGIASAEDACRALDCGATRVIVGLETLPSFQVLESIGKEAGQHRVAFSLDLRNGHPITRAPELARQQPQELVARAVDAGADTVIVLDLARVGTGDGLDLQLIAHLRAVSPGVRLYAGGGIRGTEDLERLRTAGCHGALVASALLDGQLVLPLPFAFCPLPFDLT